MKKYWLLSLCWALVKRAHMVILLAALLWPLGFAACGPRAAGETTPAPGKAAPAHTARPAWEADWERTLAAARQEGAVTVFTPYPPQWRQAFTEAMSKKYGITVDTVMGGSRELVERIMSEQRSKIYNADVAFSGIEDFKVTYQPQGVLESLDGVLVLPEVLDPNVWWRGKLAWADPDTKTGFSFTEYVAAHLLINTDMVKPEEMDSWRRLLDPKWKDKIALDDPTVSGGGQAQLTMLASRVMDWDYISAFLGQNPVLTRDRRMIVEWVARGKYPMGIGIVKSTAVQMMQSGAPISFVIPSEGAFLGLGAGFITRLKTSPHPNAAKVFLNFFLSKEGQTLSSRISGFQSSRIDVPTDYLLPILVRQPGKTYVSELEDDYQKGAPEARKRLAETFRPLVK